LIDLKISTYEKPTTLRYRSFVSNENKKEHSVKIVFNVRPRPFVILRGSMKTF